MIRVEPGTHLNVYWNPRTGKQQFLYPRSAEGAVWERGAIRDNWWTMGYLVPLYVLRVYRWDMHDDHVEAWREHWAQRDYHVQLWEIHIEETMTL